MTINHAPWTVSRYHNAMKALNLQKTIKALCGKRVPYNTADPDLAITCAACNQAQAQFEADYARIQTEYLS